MEIVPRLDMAKSKIFNVNHTVSFDLMDKHNVRYKNRSRFKRDIFN